MRKKAAWLAAGSLAGAFTIAAGLWAIYPENREKVAEFGQQIGLTAESSQKPDVTPPPSFINAGAPSSEYLPAMAAQGCSADGKIVRLIYRAAINTDERKDEVLAHPRIKNNERKYDALRRDNIRTVMRAGWQAEIEKLSVTTDQDTANSAALPSQGLTGLNFADRQQGVALERWLEKQIDKLYRTYGLQVSLRVNVQTGLDIRAPQSSAQNVCNPNGAVAPSESNDGQTPGPQPF